METQNLPPRVTQLTYRLSALFLAAVLVASVSVGLTFFLLDGRKLFTPVESNPATPAGKPPADSAVESPEVAELRFRAAMVSAIGFILSAALFYGFFRGVIRPLDLIADRTARMANGDLTALIPPEQAGRVNAVGERINDLAMNLQEVLIHVFRHANRSLAAIDTLEQQLDKKSVAELSDQFRLLRESVEELRKMVETFEYYNVRLEDTNVLAGERMETAE